MKIAITGHRPNKLGNDYNLTSPLLRNIKGEIIRQLSLIDSTPSNLILISGMALGIDTLFAKIAVEYKIVFIAAIPCKNQHRMWPQSSQDIYTNLLNNELCKPRFISNEEYTHNCMQTRNIWMVDNCDILIAVWNGTAGGTANCVSYATSKNKTIIYINPDDFK